ncbi:MAG: hypothetical protein VXY07_16405 [Planctomycetota bacterium]|jgi:hypothetical protein|nr:hypothetical protein [Planctomycetota bacterium]MEC8784416.1 hypothetical protein [Planctomycetota bacterium]MEC8861598.1 hypothetical protein [Planctomycetota bacterium]
MQRNLWSIFVIFLCSWHLGCSTESQPTQTGEFTELPTTSSPTVGDQTDENKPDPLQAIKGEMAGKFKQFFTDRTADFAERFQELVFHHNEEIEELERRANEMGQEGLQKWDDLRPLVEQQREVLKEKLQEIKEAGPSEWPRLKDEFLSVVTGLKSAIDHAKNALEANAEALGNQTVMPEKTENPKTQK